MAVYLAWFSGNPANGFGAVPSLPGGPEFDPLNNGISDPGFSTYSYETFYAGVSDVPTGDIVWSQIWVPLVSDPAPLVFVVPGRVSGFLIKLLQPSGLPFTVYPQGLLTLTATMGGVSLPGYLEWVGSFGGTYGSAAWRGVDNVPPGAPPFPAYPDTLPGPIEAPHQGAERRELSRTPGPRDARARQRDRLAIQHLVFFFSPEQTASFDAWVAADLVKAGAWFVAPDTWPVPQGGRAIRRMVGEPHYEYFAGAGWRVSFTCEVRGRGFVPAP